MQPRRARRKVAKRAGQDMGKGIATELILTVHRSTFRAQRRLDGDRDHDDVAQVAVSLVDAVGDRVAVKVYQLAAETNVELVRPPGPCRLAHPSPRSGSRSPGCQLRELELRVLTAATEGYAREGNDNGGRRDRDVLQLSAHQSPQRAGARDCPRSGHFGCHASILTSAALDRNEACTRFRW